MAELVVTLPIHLKPSCIEMDNIARDIQLTEFVGHAASFILGEIRDAALPKTKTPKRRTLGTADERSIFVENLLG